MAVYWEVFKDGERFAYGPKETMPDPGQRKELKAGGYQLKVGGKIFREGK